MFWSRIILNTDALGFHGVMVSTLDFESSDPSSNLGGTSSFFFLRIGVFEYVYEQFTSYVTERSHGVMVSTLDSESSDPSSNLGGTWF